MSRPSERRRRHRVDRKGCSGSWSAAAPGSHTFRWIGELDSHVAVSLTDGIMSTCCGVCASESIAHHFRLSGYIFDGSRSCSFFGRCYVSHECSDRASVLLQEPIIACQRVFESGLNNLDRRTQRSRVILFGPCCWRMHYDIEKLISING